MIGQIGLNLRDSPVTTQGNLAAIASLGQGPFLSAASLSAPNFGNDMRMIHFSNGRAL